MLQHRSAPGNMCGPGYAAGRRILTPTNRAAWNVTERVCERLGTADNVSLSVDESNGEGRGYLPPGELNCIESASLPPHRLEIRIGHPYMLLRNFRAAKPACPPGPNAAWMCTCPGAVHLCIARSRTQWMFSGTIWAARGSRKNNVRQLPVAGAPGFTAPPANAEPLHSLANTAQTRVVPSGKLALCRRTGAPWAPSGAPN